MLWTEIIGHEQAIDTLLCQVKAGRIGHAYLFVGTHGIGKLQVSQAFATEIISKSGNLSDTSWRIKKGLHPDMRIWSTDKNSLGVKDIREWQKAVYLPPTMAEKKIIVINEAEKLTTQAQNALLKTLEEPPLDTVFILVTSNLSKMLATVVSRCRLMWFNPLTDEQVKTGLLQLSVPEDITKYLVPLCNGSLGQALELNSKIDFEQIKDFVDSIFALIISKDNYRAFTIAEQVVKSQIDIDLFLYILETLWSMALRGDRKINDIIGTKMSFFENRRLRDIQKDCKVLAHSRKQINQYLNKQLVIETLLLKLLEDNDG